MEEESPDRLIEELLVSKEKITNPKKNRRTNKIK